MTTKNNWKEKVGVMYLGPFTTLSEWIELVESLLAEQKKELLGEIKRYQPSISKEIDTYLLQKAQDDVSLKHHD